MDKDPERFAGNRIYLTITLTSITASVMKYRALTRAAMAIYLRIGIGHIGY